MGLDMYLNAGRAFPAESNEAQNILIAAGLTLEELAAMAKRDPMEHETSVYLSTWSFTEDEERQRAIDVIDVAGLLPLTTVDSGGGDLSFTDAGVHVQVAALYWRKANAIHGWFVENCQDGVDECEESDPIDYELLASLADTCKRAVEAYDAGRRDEAAKILTPRAGFFFGGTDLDEWWRDNAERTATELERVVTTAIGIGGVTFTYRSSW